MESSLSRRAGSGPARSLLSTVKPLSSLEPDTSELDESWAKHEQPRHSYIALRSSARGSETPAPSEAPPSLPSPPDLEGHASRAGQSAPTSASGLDGHTTLAHDVWESLHALLVLVELPGVGPEHVSLSLGSHSLFFDVTQPAESEAFGIAPGHYELVIEAPDGLSPDAIDASLSNGLLRVRVSKEHAGTRRLPIASTESD